MKHLYLIVKAKSRAWGINPWIPHAVYSQKKEAIKQCEELNKKAQSNVYEVTKVINGDFREKFYE